MEVKQRGSALGHKIILFMHKILGYDIVAFSLNFVALYYVFFTPSVKKSLKSYYKHQGIELTNTAYFSHIKMFALSIFDRFTSKIKADSCSIESVNDEVIQALQEGGVMLSSHVGSWAAASNIMLNQLPQMNVVMRENTKQEIQKVETNTTEHQEEIIKIIDLSKGAIAANIQIANALMNKELVAMMADRVVDKRQSVEVSFFGSKVKINKNPFIIASRLKKPIAVMFVMNTGKKKYELNLDLIKETEIKEMAQAYANLLEKNMRKYPNQWYNFYNFFEEEVTA